MYKQILLFTMLVLNCDLTFCAAASDAKQKAEHLEQSVVKAISQLNKDEKRDLYKNIYFNLALDDIELEEDGLEKRMHLSNFNTDLLKPSNDAIKNILGKLTTSLQRICVYRFLIENYSVDLDVKNVKDILAPFARIKLRFEIYSK